MQDSILYLGKLGLETIGLNKEWEIRNRNRIIFIIPYSWQIRNRIDYIEQRNENKEDK